MANNEKHPQINLLLTRPMAGSNAFWAELKVETRQVLKPIFSPLTKIVPIIQKFEILGPVIFSSVNGVENGPKGSGRQAYCVGTTTTKAALLAGWRAIQSGETADQLVANLMKLPDIAPLTHLSGVHTRGNISERLSEAGHFTRRLAVYDQEICAFSGQAHEAIVSNFPLLVPLFSPRTAQSFRGQVKGQSPLHIVAMSYEIADQVRDLKPRMLTVSDRPTRLAMIDAVQKVASGMTLG